MAAPKRPTDRRRPAAKKAAAPRKATTSLTGLDLDALEREGAPDVLPYTFRHGGKTFTLGDPAEMDLNYVFDFINNPMANAGMFYKMLGDQEAEFREVGPFPQWKFPPLVDDWQAHYGVDVEELGKDDA